MRMEVSLRMLSLLQKRDLIPGRPLLARNDAFPPATEALQEVLAVQNSKLIPIY